MSDKQDRLKDTLEKFSKQKGALGGVLVGRDGIHMLNGIARLPAVETFSAMTATLVAAAETAMAELGSKRMRRVLAETEQQRMIAVGCSEDILLVGLVELAMPLSEAISLVDATAKSVADILAG